MVPGTRYPSIHSHVHININISEKNNNIPGRSRVITCRRQSSSHCSPSPLHGLLICKHSAVFAITMCCSHTTNAGRVLCLLGGAWGGPTDGPFSKIFWVAGCAIYRADKITRPSPAPGMLSLKMRNLYENLFACHPLVQDWWLRWFL